jgi:hypothetical protein
MMMLRMIQEGKYEFRAEQWDAISQDAKDMVRREVVNAYVESAPRSPVCYVSSRPND